MPRFHLRTKLSLGFILILLPLLALVLYTYQMESATWTDAVLEDQLQTAQAIAALADAKFDQFFAIAWAVANDPLVRTMDPSQLDPHLQQLQANYPQYVGIAVHNAAGDLVGTSSPWPSGLPRTRDAEDVPFLARVLTTGQSTISPLFPGRGSLNREAAVGVAVPVRDEAGRTIGVVSVSIALEPFSAQLQNMALHLEQSILLADPQGTAALITGWPSLSWEQRNLSQFPPIQSALQGHSSKLRNLVLPFSDDRRMGGFMPSPKYGWVVGVTEREDIALAPVWSGLRDWLIGLVVVALLSLGLILFLSNRLVQSIRRLAVQAQRIGGGDLEARVQIETGDEVEELGRTFNQMGEALRTREGQLQHLAAIVESSEDAISSTTLDGIVTSWNKGGEHLYGYRAEEIVGRSFAILIPPDYGDDLPSILGKIRKGERLQHFETVRRTKDGRRVDVSLTASPIRNATGEVTGLSAIARDITARKSAEREREKLHRQLEQHATELQVTNQELESFTYSVSHDLRAPLASIDGFSRLLQEGYGAQVPVQALRYLGLIRSNIQQMNELIASLLALSRVGRQALKKEPVKMKQLVSEVLDTLQPSTQRRDLTIDVTELPDAEADPVLLKQVWINLLSNALKFTRHRANAHIEIGCQARDGEERAYYVHDDGVGFNMEQADRLFGVFQRLHSEDEYEGNGVGLAIVARIVHRHGGRVWAVGNVDQGATFCFTLV